MSQITKTLLFSTLVVAFAGAIGCSKPSGMDSGKISAYRTEFTLSDEPDEILTVVDLRSQLTGDAPAEDHDHDGDGQTDHDAAGHDTAGHDAADHDAADHDASGHDADVHEVAHHDDQSTAQSVAIVGHIGGLANPWADSRREYPFATSEATFFLADPQAVIENEEAGHQHAPGEECAFCAAHAADNSTKIAIVSFVDDQGNPLKTDVRKLFDIQENDTVVVQGEARITEGGILVVNANGLYIRK